MKHTILGAGGAIGNVLAYELLKMYKDVRLVSRSKYWIPGTETIKADLTLYDETLRSVKDSDIVYLCAGLAYNSKVWSELWPAIMRNVIDACKSVNAKLIFFDNVYMYGKVGGIMTESTPFNPCSRKGEVRAKIAMMLESEMNKKNLTAIIARSADFYGPYATETSIPYIMAINKLSKGKRAQWMIDAGNSHSFTYTRDIAKALILLSGSRECVNQTWHLPTAEAIEGETFIHIIANALDIDPDYDVLNKWMIWMAGLFNKTISESYEMLYQYEYNYLFDSTRFNSFFNYKPKSYFEGIRETLEFLKVYKTDVYLSDPLLV